MSRLKILYLGINAKMINPTNSGILPCLKHFSDVTTFGPGYVDTATLSLGIERFVDRHGGFDLIVSDRPSWKLGRGTEAHISRYGVLAGNLKGFEDCFRDVEKFLKISRSKHILFLTYLDVYALGQDQFDDLVESGAWLVSWAAGFSRSLEDLDEDVLKSEVFYRRKVGKRPIGLWHDLIEAYGERFISLSHFVGEWEFDWSPLENRRYLVSVPGQQYARRKMVRSALKVHPSDMPLQFHKRIFSALDNLGLKPFSNKYGMLLYSELFRSSIAQSRSAYTEGSGYDRPIRKFFEIPALGTVLLASPCAGFEKLGFKDRVNAISVSPGDVTEIVKWLDGNPDMAQEIATAGRELIWESHSLHARAFQFQECFSRIFDDTFAGSQWTDGVFCVLEPPNISS